MEKKEKDVAKKGMGGYKSLGCFDPFRVFIFLVDSTITTVTITTTRNILYEILRPF